MIQLAILLAVQPITAIVTNDDGGDVIAKIKWWTNELEDKLVDL